MTGVYQQKVHAPGISAKLVSSRDMRTAGGRAIPGLVNNVAQFLLKLFEQMLPDKGMPGVCTIRCQMKKLKNKRNELVSLELTVRSS